MRIAPDPHMVGHATLFELSGITAELDTTRMVAEFNGDGQPTVCVCAWEDRAEESNRFNLRCTTTLWAGA